MSSLKRILNVEEDGSVCFPGEPSRQRPRLESVHNHENLEILESEESFPFFAPQESTLYDSSTTHDPSLSGFSYDLADPFDFTLNQSQTSDYSGLTDQTSSLSMVSTEFGDSFQERNDTPMVDMRSDTPSDLICYGMVVHELVKLVGAGVELERRVHSINKSRLPGRRTENFKIVQKLNDQRLYLTFPDLHELGFLREKWESMYKFMVEKSSVELDAVVDCIQLHQVLREIRKSSEAAIRVNINIYGPASDRDLIGNELSDKGLFLQTPDSISMRPGIVYDNPHVLVLDISDDSDDPDSGPESSTVADEPSTGQDEEFSETLAGVLSSLTRAQDLDQEEGTDELKEHLRPHQEQALTFMMQRETGDIPDKYRLWQPKSDSDEQWYQHSITRAKERERPNESGGGILADEMGMGKSLSSLALIAKTLGDGQKWAESQDTLDKELSGKTRTCATLVVVPSLILINTWEKEIKKWLPSTVTSEKYHGPKRKTLVNDPQRFDVVITTYNTLSREYYAGNGDSKLHKYIWYRVILDEAHFIRRKATTFHRAVVDLSAKSRWCLSGTPIQNSLQDLGSLLAFIQVKPFQNTGTFSHFVANPFGDPRMKRTAINRLTDLLDSFCLRRTIDTVDIPGKIEELHMVELTPEERKKYDNTKSSMLRYIQHQPGTYGSRNTMTGGFQLMLQLRILCNHGTYQHDFSWSKQDYFEEEEDEIRCIKRNSLKYCSTCRQTLPITPRGGRPKYVENCKHVLCDDCLGVSNGELDIYGEQHCPLCTHFKPPPISQYPASNSSSFHRMLRENRQADISNGTYFRNQGWSSKMKALIFDVQKDESTTKSIIFSCWRRTLDLIAHHLEEVGIGFARIDSTTPSSKRQRILDDFEGSQDSHVLIMTTGTGAFGLNLPSVNRVFIVEPQWNPSVESQAIARAIRLGQRQEVRVIRYRVKNSVEEDMFSQQAGKREVGTMNFRKMLNDQPSDSRVA